MNANYLTSSGEDFIPSIIEWGRLDVATNNKRYPGGKPASSGYEMNNAGGDCFALPIKSFKRYTRSKLPADEYDDFILLDSGRPGAFVHILHFLNIKTPLADLICGDEALHTIYSHSSTRPRRLVGVICTHHDLDHVGGIAALLALSDPALLGVSDEFINNIKTELSAHSHEMSDVDQDWAFEKEGMLTWQESEWHHLCKRAIKDIEFIICPEGTSNEFNLFELGTEKGKWEETDIPGTTEMFEQIFEQTCGQVLLSRPQEAYIRCWSRVDTSEPDNTMSDSNGELSGNEDSHVHCSSMGYNTGAPPTCEKKTDSGTTIMSPIVALRHATPSTPNSKTGNDAKFYGDNSPDNLQSLVTCYIGSYRGKQVHYVFGGDNCERIAEVTRAGLPPNKQCLDELLGKKIIGGVDIFKPDASKARARIANLIYGTSPYEYATAEKRWDMFQLNHHGSIKNVLYYDEHCVYPKTRDYSIEEMCAQLCSKARGFFATSPGTRCHADPRIFKAFCERENTQPSVRIVHMAYPTVLSTKEEHPDYSALKKKGFLETNFTVGPPSLFAVPLIPFLCDPKRIKKRVRKILSLLTLQPSGDMSKHFIYPSDPPFQGIAAISYHMIQAHRFLKLTDPIVLCLESAEYLSSDSTTRLLLQTTTEILRAFDEQLRTWNYEDLICFDRAVVGGWGSNDSFSTDVKLTLPFIELLLLRCCNQWMLLQTNEDRDTEMVQELNTTLKAFHLDVADMCADMLCLDDPKEEQKQWDGTKHTSKSCHEVSSASPEFAPGPKRVSRVITILLSCITAIWSRLESSWENICGRRLGTNSSLLLSLSMMSFSSLIQPLRQEIAKVLEFVDREGKDTGIAKPRTLRVKLLDCFQSMVRSLSAVPSLSATPATGGDTELCTRDIFPDEGVFKRAMVKKKMKSQGVDSTTQQWFSSIYANVKKQSRQLRKAMQSRLVIAGE